MSGLPVEASVPALRAALVEHGSAVLTAEPGAGKTTVVPLRLLDLGPVVMLEPRRIATRAAARRMASTFGEDVGATVGYRTRDERRTGPATRLEVVTEGVLTRRLQRDRDLPGVGLVVFDEFHERNLQADLGLALVLDLRRTTRPDLRILVMSATLDVDRVAALLGGAPVVRSEGRQHPVDVRWLPRPPRQRLDDAVEPAVRRALREEDGDVLVFLPGMGDIRRAADRLAGVDADVLVLHGSLPAAEQDRALQPAAPGARKIVLATDVAETSLTVEGVRVVVDAGLRRVPRFDAATATTRLQTVAASKASTDQRAGRAGRTAPGVAYRLWSKLEHATRRPHIEPEILHTDLAGLALELAAWGTDDPRVLPFLDQPPRRAFEDGRALLRDLGALDGGGRLTPVGEAMAALPLHPRLARMVVTAPAADRWLACALAAVIEEGDPLRGHPDQLPVAIEARVGAVRADRVADIARRAGVDGAGPGDAAAAGPLLEAAYPDRVARRRGAGHFQLRSGKRLWMRPGDALADEPYVVVAAADGNGRIRMAAPAHDRSP